MCFNDAKSHNKRLSLQMFGKQKLFTDHMIWSHKIKAC